MVRAGPSGRRHDYTAEPFAKYSKIEAQFRRAAQQPGKLHMNYVSAAALMPPR